MQTRFINLAERFYNRPHLITPEKARFLLGVFAQRQGASDLILHEADSELRLDQLKPPAAANAYVDGRADRRLFPVVGENIAVIEASGTLVAKNGLDPHSGMTGYDGMARKLSAALDDDGIRGILFDIDSCGGEVSGLFDMAEDIRVARNEKPVWAVATDEAYSAAYALGGSCDRLYLPETGGVGSIGVVTMHVDCSRRLNEDGLEVTLIHAGAHKVDGNPFAPLPDDVRADITAEIETVRGVFVQSLEAAGRISAADALATEARCYRGPAAVAAGLADGFMPGKSAVAAFIDFLDGKTAVAFPAATAAHLQPRKEATMANKSSVPNAGGRGSNRSAEAPKENDEAVGDEDEEDAAAAQGSEDDEQAADSPDEDQDQGGDDEDEAGEDSPKPAKAKTGQGKTVNTATAQQIIALSEADDQPRLAQSLAFAGVDVEAAQTCLAAAAKDRAAVQPNSLRASMANAPKPAIGADGGKSGDRFATCVAAADKVAAKYQTK